MTCSSLAGVIVPSDTNQFVTCPRAVPLLIPNARMALVWRAASLWIVVFGCIVNVHGHGSDHGIHHRSKRQSLAGPVVKGYIAQALEEANRELAEQKALDQAMLAQGVDVPSGTVSYFWHLGRFLYTKDRERVGILSDKAWVIVRATKKLVEMTGMPLRNLMTNPIVVEEWRQQVRPACPFKPPTCDPRELYRSADGSCNNFKDPTLGAALTRQRRMMLNSYEDGLDFPRVYAKSKRSLPSPRTISNVVHSAGECPRFSDKMTVMVMQFGQFIEHDVISTPMITGHDGADIMCCDTPPQILPRRAPCFPIPIPPNDERFKEPCMNFVRSVPGLKVFCDMGIRSPLNQASGFMDSSQVYGTSQEEQSKLRAGQGGLMRMTNLGLPPEHTEETCMKEVPTDYCMFTGDFRVNHVPGLTVMHTMFLRRHNRIASALSRLNPHWNDETTFQETRKIIIAIQQHTVFNELLPTILNHETMMRYGLYSRRQGHDRVYEEDEDCSIMMGFSGAAMRFPHTRIPDVQSMVDKHFTTRQDAPIMNVFDKPKFVLQNQGRAIDYFARWLTAFPVMKDDRRVEDGVRNFLFMDDRGRSFDLVSLNIQRARDQGIPPYNEWRKLCGLPPARYFAAAEGGLVDHDEDDVRLLAEVYEDPDDIDLFTGGLSERNLPDSAIGPTFSCIIASQFRSIKRGDRFWYENPFRTGFTPEQLAEIKKVRVSKILCTDMDVPEVQPNVFRFPGPGNERVGCQNLEDLNLAAWRD